MSRVFRTCGMYRNQSCYIYCSRYLYKAAVIYARGVWEPTIGLCEYLSESCFIKCVTTLWLHYILLKAQHTTATAEECSYDKWDLSATYTCLMRCCTHLWSNLFRSTSDITIIATALNETQRKKNLIKLMQGFNKNQPLGHIDWLPGLIISRANVFFFKGRSASKTFCLPVETSCLPDENGITINVTVYILGLKMFWFSLSFCTYLSFP